MCRKKKYFSLIWSKLGRMLIRVVFQKSDPDPVFLAGRIRIRFFSSDTGNTPGTETLMYSLIPFYCCKHSTFHPSGDQTASSNLSRPITWLDGGPKVPRFIRTWSAVIISILNSSRSIDLFSMVYNHIVNQSSCPPPCYNRCSLL